jgi:DNA-binding XRE family transcriptional regulator
MDGNEFKRRRERLRYTQPEIAALLGVHEITISKWERGVHRIQESVALALQHMKPKQGGTKKRKR